MSHWTLAGAPNARDLGGLVSADGRRVRRGVLVRAGALGRLTDDDLPVLAALGLVCLVDLRHESEIAIEPPSRLPDPSPRLIHLPVFDPDHPAFAAVSSYIAAAWQGQDLNGYAGRLADGTPAAMTEIYRWFVAGAGARASFAAAVRALADPANLPALFHCSVGKDRTGWLTVIVLTAVGVDEDAIRRDYLRTNEVTAGVQRLLLDRLVARRPEVDLDAIRPMLEAREEYLDAAHDEVRRRYGTFDAYLGDGLGLDGDLLAALRDNLLE
jgi:protein-tyrosine phosphatase